MRAIDCGELEKRISSLARLARSDAQISLLGRVLYIVENMPTLTPPNEWVSVEDTVPDPGERVLATDGIFVGEAYRTSADSWHRHTGFPWRDGVTGRTVKYWMLLPAPPAKEDQK